MERKELRVLLEEKKDYEVLCFEDAVKAHQRYTRDGVAYTPEEMKARIAERKAKLCKPAQ